MWWKDTGKPEDLLDANRLVLEHCRPKIDGPIILGRDCVIENSYVGPNTSIGDSTEIRSSEIESSIVLDRCKILNVKTRLKGSILGYDVEITEGVSRTGMYRFLIGDQSRVDVGWFQVVLHRQ
jgi:glucose-1-phosphate thymidylyltransferase